MGNLERAKNITTMEKLVQGTVQNANGTSVDFTGIPSWAKKITVMFNGISTSGISHFRVQLGSSSLQTSGYVGTGYYFNPAVSGVTLANGFDIPNNQASPLFSGNMSICLLGSNMWNANGQFSNGVTGSLVSGGVTLSGILDRIRITTVNGTDTFDAGQINILVEG